MEATSISGNQLGRQLGFPTINLETSYQAQPAQPAQGVYLARVSIQQTPSYQEPKLIHPDLNQLLPAMVNIGRRPSVEQAGEKDLIEVHLLEAPAFLSKQAYYNKHLSVFFASVCAMNDAFRA